MSGSRTLLTVVVSVVAVPAVAVISGCEKQPVEPRFEGPMPVTFGECAPASVAWISGPKPLPFTEAEALDPSTPDPTRIAQQDPPKLPEPEPPIADEPKPDKRASDDNGGTGTRMALEKGKMGTRDSDRAEGQYKMRRGQDEPQLARQQAIEQARTAGIIGSTALTKGGEFASLTGTADISSGFDDTNIYGGLLGNEAGEMNGGFGYGRSGFGPGGGGTGWGTIGTGRYGTIGHGSGTGSGYGIGGGRGGMRGRSSAVPTVTIGQPSASGGDLDKAIIRRYIKRNHQKFSYCYEKELLAKPALQGTVMAAFFIAPTGSVKTASASGVDPEVARCVADVIKNIEFPEPKGGGGVQVNYPFTFRPAGDGGARSPAGGTPVGSAGQSGSGASDAAAGSATSTTGSATTGSAAIPAAGAPEPVEKRRLFRGDELGPVDAANYTPGKTNPLRAQQAALVDCLRKNPEHHGVLVIESAYDPSGKATTAIVHGITHDKTKACLEKVAKQVKRDRGGAAERCSLAFGEMPLTALPAIEIGNGKVTLDDAVTRGKALAVTIEPDARTVPPIVEAIKARVDAATAGNGPVVSLHGPIAIRADSTAPMKQVDSVLLSVVYGGDDFVLAVKRDTWRPVTPLALPLPPVPYGTGGRWHRIKGKSRGVAIVDDSERVQLSILVGKERTWVGLSRVNEFHEIAAADVAQKLPVVLKDLRATPYLKDRNDLELAAEGDVSYGDFVKAVELVTAAGFVDWRHTDPAGLAARPTL